jgi:hypothetical protein
MAYDKTCASMPNIAAGIPSDMERSDRMREPDGFLPCGRRCKMTGKNWNPKARKTLAILLVMAILFSLVGSLTPLAQEPEPLSPDAPDASKVGVEWVADFDQCPANDLPNCTQPECMKLYNALVGEGWTGSFHWGNSAAWETDFKRAAAGGSENSWIDSVDLGLFCSHGSGAYDTFWAKPMPPTATTTWSGWPSLPAVS